MFVTWFTMGLISVFSFTEDANNTWFSDSQENVGFQGDDSLLSIPYFLSIIRVFQGQKDGNYESCRQHFGGN